MFDDIETVPTDIVDALADEGIPALQLSRVELALISRPPEMACWFVKPSPKVCAGCPLMAFCSGRVA